MMLTLLVNFLKDVNDIDTGLHNGWPGEVTGVTSALPTRLSFGLLGLGFGHRHFAAQLVWHRRGAKLVECGWECSQPSH